jgi:hypothetical protein
MSLPGYDVDADAPGLADRTVGAAFPLAKCKEQFRRTRYGDVIVREIRAPWNDFISYVPAQASPDELVPHCLLSEVIVDRDELEGDLCDIQLVFEQEPGSSSEILTIPLPATEWVEAAAGVDVDIRQHPQWATGHTFRQYWDFAQNQFKDSAPAYLRGLAKFIGGAGQFVLTQYSRTPYGSTFSLIGKRLNPDDVDSALEVGDAGKWLCIDASRGKRLAFYYRQLVLQYSATDWPTEVYAAAEL